MKRAVGKLSRIAVLVLAVICILPYPCIGAPDIDVSQTPIAFEVAPDDTASSPLTIGNTGDAALTWRIVEKKDGTITAPAPPVFVPSSTRDKPVNWNGKYVPGELIVGFKPGVKAEEHKSVHAACGGKARTSFKIIPADVVTLPENADLRAAAARYLRNPNVAYAEPNYILHAHAIPNDWYFSSQWNLHSITDADIDAPEAWDHNTGSDSILVGVIDSGIGYLHQDLGSNIWTNPGEIPNNSIDDDGNGYVDDVCGYSFAYDRGDPMDFCGHGTSVAGIIGAEGNNAMGIAGVNWRVKMAAIAVLDAYGYGTTEDAVASVQYAVTIHCNLTNNSYGGGVEEWSQAFNDAIAAAGAAGQLFIASAGNDHSNNDLVPVYPASCTLDNVIAVAGSGTYDELTLSNYGSVSVDLAAPGAVIPTTAFLLDTWEYDYDFYFGGTSAAAPHVSGAAALCLAESPGATPAEVKSWIIRGVDPRPGLVDYVATGGRLNLHNSLHLAGVEWLGGDPKIGTTPPGGSTSMEVSANTAGLQVGFTDTAWIEFRSNDPDEPAVQVPVTLLVSWNGRHIRILSPVAGECREPWITTVIWSTPGTDWQADDTVRIEYSDNGGTTWLPIPGAEDLPYNAGSYDWVTAGLPSGAQYRVRVTCTDDPTATRSTGSFRLQPDTGLPTMSLVPLKDTQDTAGPYPVTADVTDSCRGVRDVTLYWRRNGAETHAVPMVVSDPVNSPRRYRGNIPGPSSAGEFYEYYVAARDNALTPNIGRSPATGYHRFAIQGRSHYFTQQFGSTPNDLDYLSFMFVPDGSAGYYSMCVSSIASLPTDPTGGTTFSLKDNDYALVALSGGAQVLLYGNAVSSFYIGSNGYITLDRGSTAYAESSTAHFGLKRISALYDDLNPHQAGVVSWKQLEDRAAVTFQDVPEHTTATPNTFQIEMFYDGRIRISYLQVSATDGLAGLSAGTGVPADFAQDDLSAWMQCAAPSINLAKRGADGWIRALFGKVVSRVFPGDRFYVQEEDRASGMGVLWTGTMPGLGDRVTVSGSMTTLDGERLLQCTGVYAPSPGTQPRALGLPTLTTGGGDSEYAPGPPPFGQQGVNDGTGLNNIGLLITIWGKVTQIGTGYLYVDDGSGIRDGTSTGSEENAGVRVVCDSVGYSKGDFVMVTGISSCFQTPAGAIARRVLARAGDIRRP